MLANSKAIALVRSLICSTLLIVLCIGVAPAKASADVDDTFQLWAALLSNGSMKKSSPRLRGWLDIHARRGDNTVLIVRPGIGYQLTKGLTLWAGYAWIPNFNHATETRSDEHRIWQQMTLGHSFSNGISLSFRLRTEQRFSDQGDDVAFRVRGFMRMNYQPRKQGRMGLALWDELFVGITKNDWSAPQGFDQNRLFVGPFLKTGKFARLEAGYLFVYVNREPTSTIAHVLAVNLFLSLQPQ